MKHTLLFSSVMAGLLLTSCGTKSTESYSETQGMTGATMVSSSNKKMTQNAAWWPNSLNLGLLKQHSELSNPMGEDFDYRAEFAKLDYAQLKEDIRATLTDSKEWWPADWGHYGGLFIRMAWHSAGTYRTADGRGGSRSGQQRFAPINSWPDNANLDKARRLMWPVKQKYGSAISWADLFVLAGNVALEDMGFKTFGFSAGREDVFEPELDVYWGKEDEWLANDERYKEEKLEYPLAAVQMGLIYVNPEGPNGNPDPVLAAHDIRETFGRMGMNDEETVALIVGGHTLGKTHGKGTQKTIQAEPEGAPIQEQGFGWKNTYQSGVGKDANTSGLEVIWTSTPTKWGHEYLHNLFEYEWELTKSPSGAHQWVAKDAEAKVPDAFEDGKFHKPTMLTTDLSMKADPAYEKISRKFYENPEAFDEAFARAWFKLTHRDMGPRTTYLGPEAPTEDLIWHDPIPEVNHKLVNKRQVNMLKDMILNSGLSTSELVETAWASASTYRNSDRRGGANGARIQLEPMKNWEVNNPQQLEKVLSVYRKIQKDFKGTISMADLIVLGGYTGIEAAAKKAGYKYEFDFEPGRMDATQEMTDVESFELLKPMADGFRNYKQKDYVLSTEELLVDKAQLLTLTPAEMTVLVGGMRTLHANYDNSTHGFLSTKADELSNDFFTQLLSMETKWEPVDDKEELFNGIDRATGEKKYTATRADLIFGSNSELRAIAEVYGASNAKEKFVKDFFSAWEKVMKLDRFDLQFMQ